MRKKVIAFLLLFALTVVSLAGCGKQEETDKKKDTAALRKPIHIRFLWQKRQSLASGWPGEMIISKIRMI